MFAQADARPTRVGRTSLPSVVMDILAFRRRVQRGRSPLWRGLGGAPNPHPLRFPPGNSAGSGGRVQRERSPLWRGLGGTPPPSAPLPAREFGGFRRESPERAQPSLVGDWGTPPTSIRSASRQGIRRVPAGESREGGALVGGGLGVPPQPLSAQLPAREFGGFRRESPERAEPSLVGAWGYPPQPLSAPLPAREVERSSAGRGLRPLRPSRPARSPLLRSRRPRRSGTSASAAKPCPRERPERNRPSGSRSEAPS